MPLHFVLYCTRVVSAGVVVSVACDSCCMSVLHVIYDSVYYYLFFFFNDTATTEIYTRSLVGSVRCV